MHKKVNLFFLLSFQVKTLHQMGDYEGAKRASEHAMGHSLSAIVVGIIILIIVVILNAVRATQHQ